MEKSEIYANSFLTKKRELQFKTFFSKIIERFEGKNRYKKRWNSVTINTLLLFHY